MDYPKMFASRRVLDVGSGCGASAIAAAMMGASVVANDISQDAIEASKVNAALNNVSINTSIKNYIGETDIDYDIVFLGDMFYDKEFTNIVHDWIRDLSQNGTRILICDPGRVHLLGHPIMDELQVLHEYEIPLEYQETGFGLTKGVVWTFCPTL